MSRPARVGWIIGPSESEVSRRGALRDAWARAADVARRLRLATASDNAETAVVKAWPSLRLQAEEWSRLEREWDGGIIPGSEVAGRLTGAEADVRVVLETVRSDGRVDAASGAKVPKQADPQGADVELTDAWTRAGAQAPAIETLPEHVAEAARKADAAIPTSAKVGVVAAVFGVGVLAVVGVAAYARVVLPGWK